MKILFLTWKDSKHPFAGGAEHVMHEYAKGLVQFGHEVTRFSYTFPGARSKEKYDGVTIIRKFTLKTSSFLFPLFYKKYFKGKFDMIIDEAGGVPLLSPLFEKKIPIVFFVHHVGDKERDYHYPRPLGAIGKRIYYQFFKVYKNCPTLAVSQSTKTELMQKFGFKDQNIRVIENACDIAPLDTLSWGRKEDKILFLGRLMPIKRAEDAIQAFSIFVHSDKKFAHYTLDIVGNAQDKKYIEKLKEIAIQCAVAEKVHFCGFIARESFQSFISAHKVMVVPSIKEGFGLIVLEGNSYGLPVIGYDVPGLRESIQEGKNGFLISNGDWKAMGEKIKSLLSDDELLKKTSQEALKYVKTLPDWGEQVRKVEEYLNGFDSFHKEPKTALR